MRQVDRVRERGNKKVRSMFTRRQSSGYWSAHNAKVLQEQWKLAMQMAQMQANNQLDAA